MTQQGRTEIVSLRMDDDILRAVKAIAAKEDRPTSWVLRMLLRLGLDSHKRRPK